MDKVEKNPDSGCWIWTGPKFKTGYGTLSYQGRSRGVHRIMAVITGLISDIRAKQEVHHTCAEYTCVNPDHLVLGTYKDRIYKTTVRPRPSTSQDLNPKPNPNPWPKPFDPNDYTKKPIQKPINPRLGTSVVYGVPLSAARQRLHEF